MSNEKRPERFSTRQMAALLDAETAAAAIGKPTYRAGHLAAMIERVGMKQLREFVELRLRVNESAAEELQLELEKLQKLAGRIGRAAFW